MTHSFSPIPVVAILLLGIPASAISGAVDFIRINSPRIVLAHVDVIDGTGVPVKTNQTIVIDVGRIAAIGPVTETATPSGAEILDLLGRTVFPGLVGMHDHLFYAADAGRTYVSLPRTFARLSLAAGVTTIRTAGAINLAQDIAIKRDIDEGREAGPKIHLSSPYLEATSDLATLEQTIERLADAGVTSLKAYTTSRRAELAAAIRTAHRRGLKVTGHLCAVGFREAAAMGIDNLEHGIIVDSEFYSGKVADQCPDQGATIGELMRTNVESAAIQQTIRTLVEHGVAVTSTLAVFETLSARTGFFDRRVEALLFASAWDDYVSEVQWRNSYPSLYASGGDALAFEMAFERSFVRAGGLLMAGADPTGWGGVLAGFADQRNIELLVGAGFTPEQAIQIASANGAAFLGESDRIGTIQVGKQADLVVVRGHPASRIADIRNVELVFKDGVGFDPKALTESEHGNIGAEGRFPWIAIAIGPAVVLLLIGWHYLKRRWRRAA